MSGLDNPFDPAESTQSKRQALPFAGNPIHLVNA